MLNLFTYFCASDKDFVAEYLCTDDWENPLMKVTITEPPMAKLTNVCLTLGSNDTLEQNSEQIRIADVEGVLALLIVNGNSLIPY